VIARWMSTARSWSMHATTEAVGWDSAISRARLGPDRTAMRFSGAPVTSAMTSVMRSVEPSSMPFMRLSSVASGSRCSAHAARLPRRVWLGTDRTTRSAPRRATAASAVAETSSGRSMSGK